MISYKMHKICANNNLTSKISTKTKFINRNKIIFCIIDALSGLLKEVKEGTNCNKGLIYLA